MVSRSILVILIPLPLSVAILLAVGGVWLEQERSAEDVDELTRNHVRGVVDLVREATQVALAIHAEGFADLEARLIEESAILLDPTCVASCLDRSDPWLVVRVVEDGGVPSLAEWGPIPAEERFSVDDPEGGGANWNLFEPAVESAPALVCTRGGHNRRRGVFCADAGPLERRLQAIGPGAILRDVEARGVEYVAIQDAGGILAASPSVDTLSAVEHDPFLNGLAWSDPEAVHYRTTFFNDGEVLEGVGQIGLPDGTKSLLRVGVDATRLSQVAAQREARRSWLILTGALVVLLACLAAWALHRRVRMQDRYRADQERYAREEARWQDLGRMAAMTAHEVRNPLATIRMAAQRIEMEHAVTTDGNLRELSAIITSEVDRLDGVVGDFLSLSRPLSIDPKPVALRALADEVALSQRMRTERDGQEITVTGDPSIEALVDRARMFQLIDNLAHNALDAAGDSGKVEIRVGLDAKTHSAVIEVMDNGPGMNEEQQVRALETFHTTKSFGTGLGLPLVKRIAEGHHGSLELENRPEGGLCARVRVPWTRKD